MSSSLSATLFLGLSLHLGAKRLGVRIPWRPPGSKIVSRIEIRTSEISKKRSAFFGKMELVCFQDPFRNAPGHHFGRFGMDLAIILAQFSMDFLRPRANEGRRKVGHACVTCVKTEPKTIATWSLAGDRRPLRNTVWRAAEGRHRSRSTDAAEGR